MANAQPAGRRHSRYRTTGRKTLMCRRFGSGCWIPIHVLCSLLGVEGSMLCQAIKMFDVFSRILRTHMQAHVGVLWQRLLGDGTIRLIGPSVSQELVSDASRHRPVQSACDGLSTPRFRGTSSCSAPPATFRISTNNCRWGSTSAASPACFSGRTVRLASRYLGRAFAGSCGSAKLRVSQHCGRSGRDARGRGGCTAD